jgi:hypothetical protein
MNANRFSGIWVPGLVVLLTGTYAYWVAQRELVSSRPTISSQYDVPDPVPTPGVRTVHSRMWEDPLSTAYIDFKRVRAAEAGAKGETKFQTVVTTIPDGRMPAVETVWSRWFSSLGKSKQELTPSRLNDSQFQMKEHFRELVDNAPTLCLPVFVPGGPYADDKEKRMRIRYSLVTALAESGYSMQYNERMSYVVAKIYVRTLRAWEQREIVIPVKLYRGPGPQVLVVWINESEVGLRPLLTIHRILNEIYSEVNKPENLSVSIIGPASSNMLKEMAGDVNDVGNPDRTESTLPQWKRSDHWKYSAYTEQEPKPIEKFCPLLDPNLLNRDSKTVPVSIFSPRATVEAENEVKYFQENKYFKLYRVIGTDQQLAAALKQELELRNVLPGNVVLVTEHDTRYGREIQKTFEKAFGLVPRGVTKESDSRLYTFKILRGIDGILPGDPKESSKSSSSKGNSTDPAVVVERQPEGRSQYDYLTRLSERIRSELPDKPVAIGVVGSDVYDKLLVLRALKPQFPDCVFFTTDLDAIYSHPDERQHTRNLIIASHFGLSLGSEMQQETAPFRDSYQTATFLATRLAIYADKIERRAMDQATSLEIRSDELKHAAEGDEHIMDLAEEIRLESEKVRMAAYLKHPGEFRPIAVRIEEKLAKLANELKGRQSLVESWNERVENHQEPASKLKDEPYASAKICIDGKKAIQSIVTELKEQSLWEPVLSRLGNHPRKAAIQPVIHVVGQNGTQQLTYFKSDGKDDLAVEAMVHVSPSPGMSGWHISFIAVVTVGAVLCVLLLTLRNQFCESLLLCCNWDDVEESWADKVRSWQKVLNYGLLSLLSIGLLLIVGLVLNAWLGNYVAAPFDGYTTWTRNMLYALTGMIALVLKQAKAASGFADILARSRLRGNAGVAWGFG